MSDQPGLPIRPNQVQALAPMTSSIRTISSTLSVKLNGKNYPAWKFSIKETLINRQLASVVYLSSEGLTPSQIELKDAEASELLTNALEPQIFNKILICQTAREIWERLRLIYEQEGDSNLETSIIAWSCMKQGKN